MFQPWTGTSLDLDSVAIITLIFYPLLPTFHNCFYGYVLSLPPYLLPTVPHFSPFGNTSLSLLRLILPPPPTLLDVEQLTTWTPTPPTGLHIFA